MASETAAIVYVIIHAWIGIPGAPAGRACSPIPPASRVHVPSLGLTAVNFWNDGAIGGLTRAGSVTKREASPTSHHSAGRDPTRGTELADRPRADPNWPTGREQLVASIRSGNASSSVRATPAAQQARKCR
ncbi:hypothetical protein GCM10022226_49890 [Sphaerisporangium flaviroseum]|uniref:Uncharacterized protein n=1 Tax=Sphaerisporangium flaviroseum TaxID=509199 RepID=A0ABP7IPB8_9ACTN